MTKYILYVRKSTDETNRQLLSLDAQTRELRELVKREGIAVVDFLEESRTAKAPGRPVFNTMLADALKMRSKPRHVRKGHNFPFCGLFRCSCGSMITGQWAKGRGGMYRYYRCVSCCGEKYLREEALTEQLLGLLAPIGITADEGQHHTL